VGFSVPVDTLTPLLFWISHSCPRGKQSITSVNELLPGTRALLAPPGCVAVEKLYVVPLTLSTVTSLSKKLDLRTKAMLSPGLNPTMARFTAVT
jgi:hypothetical protein